jgi:glutamate-1-semialdehyde 2,1-aminomutase
MAAGFPIAALTGKRELMQLFGSGAVNHSGTYNASVPLVAAAVATLKELARDNGAALQRIEKNGTALIEGLRRAAADAGVNLMVSGVGGVFNTTFGDHEVFDYQSYKRTDLKKQQRFLAGLVARGIRPIPRGTWFVSAAHSMSDVDETVAVAADVLRTL